MTQVELKVYAPDATTLLTTLPARRFGVQWKDESNGVGSGQFALQLDDDALVYDAAMLNPFNVVKCRPVNEAGPVMAWRLENLTPAQIDRREGAGQVLVVSGRHVRSILDEAVVLGDGDRRVFDFSSPTGAWYIGADWITPIGVAADSDTGFRMNAPRTWPDPLAHWIWSSDPEASAPAGRNWFRGSFTLAAETAVKVWVSGDNAFDFRINGESLIKSDPSNRYAWMDTYTAEVVLPAGTHLAAAWVDNYQSGATNPGAFIATIGTADSSGELDTVLLRTGNAAWKVHSYANPPGWHAAQILIRLLTEAQAAGYLPDVSWDFTDTLDSNGQPWTDNPDDIQDVQIGVGTDLLTVSNMWAGTVYDIDMTPDLVLRCFMRRGSDLSPTVVFTAGVDVVALAPTIRYAPIRNVLLAQHLLGRETVTDVSSTVNYGKRAAGLSVGDAGSAAQAIKAANEALEDLGAPQTTISLEASSAVGPQPYADFGLGDTISVPDFPTGQTDARVMAITVLEQENHLSYSIDLYPEGGSLPPPALNVYDAALYDTAVYG